MAFGKDYDFVSISVELLLTAFITANLINYKVLPIKSAIRNAFAIIVI